MEDIELGYRLHRQHGLQMTFLPDAIADHVHPISFLQTCKRTVDAGENIFRMRELWPEYPLACAERSHSNASRDSH